MPVPKLVWAVAHVLLGLILLAAYRKTDTPFKNMLICAGLGILALAGISLTAGYTDITLGMNAYTLATSAILGVPGVILMLLFNLLFK